MREKLSDINAALTAWTLSCLSKVGMRDKVERVATGEQVWVDSGIQSAPAQLPSQFAADERGQLGLQTILAALVVVIASSLAVIVVDQFDQSLGDPQSSDLSVAQNDVLGGFSDMTSLVGPLLLVAIAVVIIGLVRRVS